MADLIATEAYAQSIGGINISYTSNLGCTKSRAIALGCEVAGTYEDNQLVCQKDLNKASTIKYSLKNSSSDDLANIKVQAGSCIFAGNLPMKGILYTTSVPSGHIWSIIIDGNTSNQYMIYPAPDSNIRSYILQEKSYIYEISFTPINTVEGNLTRVFVLSNMDDSLVGTKNYISATGATNDYIIYTNTNSSGSIGSFIGNYCTNQGGPIHMVNGNKYSILYTVIDTSSNNYLIPAGTITKNWTRVYEFEFNSNVDYYQFNITA